MNVPDILEFFVNLFRYWRLNVCLGISILLAFSLHGKLGSDPWVYFLSVACVLAGVGTGFVCQSRSET